MNGGAFSDGWWQGRRVVFVSGTAGDTRRFRCDYAAEQLRHVGAETDVLAWEDGASLADVRLGDADCLVLHRLEWDEGVEELLTRAGERGVPSVFDTDDLVFDADAAVSWFVGLGAEGRRGSFDRQRRTLAACDAATVSTRPLARFARAVNSRVAVTPNAAGVEMLREGEAARVAREGVSVDPPLITYLSGTPTHDRDVLDAADGLVTLLETFPDAHLLVVGYLELDERFDPFAERLERRRFQPRERLPGLLARSTVAIAPLERGNPFAQAKSCLKYLEAALVATPTVATDAPDFVRAIGHGDNGLLVRRPSDWADALATVLAMPEYAASVGRRAYADVRARQTTAARAPAFARTLALLVLAATGGRPLEWRGPTPADRSRFRFLMTHETPTDSSDFTATADDSAATLVSAAGDLVRLVEELSDRETHFDALERELEATRGLLRDRERDAEEARTVLAEREQELAAHAERVSQLENDVLAARATAPVDELRRDAQRRLASTARELRNRFLRRRSQS